MCSAPAVQSSNSDLTARARIRDAAILHFGRDGYAKTSVRTIATKAGVSPALVIHHFGNKEALKRACDDHIAHDLLEQTPHHTAADLLSTLQHWLAEPEKFQPEFDYLSRMIMEGAGTADRLFDNLVDRTEQMLTEGASSGLMTRFSDPRTVALLIATQGLAPLLLAGHVARNLGEHSLNTTALQKLAIPGLELYTHGLYTTDDILNAASAAMPNTATGDEK